MATMILVISVLFLSCSSVLEAGTVFNDWEVTEVYRSPDCYRKVALTINGQIPGPTIKANKNDQIVVKLTNKLVTENTAIHWHGIRQIKTPWFDGTEGVTQCPIQPGETFTYNFTVDQSGTYSYHAHYGMQRESGLFGSIIVSSSREDSVPFSYDEEANIMLNDWYHSSTQELQAGLSSIPFRWIGEPQSLLINGRGNFRCSDLDVANKVCNQSSPECSPFELVVGPGKVYRLRLTSLTSLSALSFQIEGHNLTVVEADGHYVEPFLVKNLYIYSGETYSVLVETNKEQRSYYMSTTVVARNATTPAATAVFRYSSSTSGASQLPPAPHWNDVESRFSQSLAIKAHKDHVITPPLNSSRTLVMLGTQNKINGNTRWSINNVSFTHPRTPWLIALKENLVNFSNSKRFTDGHEFLNYDIYNVAQNTNATKSDAIYALPFGSTVDVILQNSNTMTVNNSETHPWHLHGHDFWVLGYGKGLFNLDSDPKKFNLVNPITKNSVPLHPYGWTALRFKADNPGVWAFHCHIESHFFMGMGVVFQEGVNRIGKLPASIMGCGDSKSLIKP